MVGASFEAIVIGASAGAIDALAAILPELPRDFPVPIMVVVHLPVDKKSLIVQIFQQKCQISVVEAEDKVPLEPGTVYFAPADYHLLVEPERVLSLSVEEQVNYSRPSIDVLFETAALAFGHGLLGIVLTGANNDGAAGLRCILDAGGTAIVQQPDSAYASAMPMSAIDRCPEARVMNLVDIAKYLQGIKGP
ncbi:chemotaxis protein CheB [Aeoliella sp. SH292]|uniref:chemotaxis protein CheB n=1 Tax=Aeoliella sp. SH292 TaxID=3454464 RepID=UPI003F9C2333